MDPDVALIEIRKILPRILNDESSQDLAIELAELVSGLDQWLDRGGRFPTEWILWQPYDLMG